MFDKKSDGATAPPEPCGVALTVYVVNEGKVLFHHHKKYKIRFPLGRHVEEDEFSHEPAVRKVKESSGLDAKLAETEIKYEMDLTSVKRMSAPFCLLYEEIS